MNHDKKHLLKKVLSLKQQLTKHIKGKYQLNKH